MIKSCKNKAIKLCIKGDYSKIDQRHMKRLRLILNALATSTCVDDVDLPGMNLHSFKERTPVVWSLDVSANYRITFSFDGKDIIDVDYLDTH